MTPDELRARLAALVASLAPASSPAESITDDTVLLDGGIDLDSLSLLDLVVSIDDELGVQVASADVTPEHFATFGRLVAYVTPRANPEP